MKKLAKKTKTSSKQEKKTSTKTKKEEKPKKPDKSQIIEAQKGEAIQLVVELSKHDVAFGNSWRVFQSNFSKAMGTLEEYQKYLEEKKNATLQIRNQLLETMRNVVPKIKDKLGEQGSKNKIAYVMAQNIDRAEFRHVHMLRRLIDRYEELFGDIYPKALPEPEKETNASASEGHNIHVTYSTFEKGKEEFVALLEALTKSVEDDQFEELIIRINARGEFRGFKLVVK